MSYSPRASPPRKSLVENAEKSWQQRTEKWSLDAEKHDYYSYNKGDDEENTYKRRFRQPSPRSRRNILIICVILLCAWTAYTRYIIPWRAKMAEDTAVAASIHKAPLGDMTAHIPPAFGDIVLVQELSSKFVPTDGKKQKHREGRLIVVGDVHGMKESLVRLLDRVNFDRKHDHLILAGDMISKGPDSVGVLDLVMELGDAASAVRGNHEDRVLLAWDAQQARLLHLEKDEDAENSPDEELGGKGKKREQKDRVLAKQLSKKHVHWLKQLPVILRIGEIEGMGEVVVVHAGLVPGLDLGRQDPYFVMNMRTMDLETRVPSDESVGTSWTKFWNHHQSSLSPHKRSTVIYGHDSKRGLNIQKYTKGIDTGCLKGGQLTALVIKGGKDEAIQTLIQVGCEDGRA